MCWFFKKKNVTSEPKKEITERSRADEIRKFVRAEFITPVRKKGDARVSFTAGEIQAAMTAGHENTSSMSEQWQGVRLQSIISAIDARKFCEFARIKMTKRTEKKGTSTVRWTFEL
jgi:hypothetical protein